MTTVLGGQQQLQYGTTTLHYELTYSKRKRLAIHVYPDGSIVVDAPVGTTLPDVEAKLLQRAAWIVGQQRQFQEYAAPRVLPRRYVSGETFAYLGRHYRLKLVEDRVKRVTLSRGYLTVTLPNMTHKAEVAAMMEGWYRRRAHEVFAERLAACYPRVESLGIPYPALAVRIMKSRWGSCTAAGKITLNLTLMQVPKPLIDYVIVHELCHLKEHNHSHAFYALLERVQPDWRERRQRLNQAELMEL